SNALDRGWFYRNCVRNRSITADLAVSRVGDGGWSGCGFACSILFCIGGYRLWLLSGEYGRVSGSDRSLAKRVSHWSGSDALAVFSLCVGGVVLATIRRWLCI